VTVGKDFAAQAEGRTKKIAAQRAARNAYSQIRQSGETSA
jgi:dsRNA-specific ribonuclease